MQVKFQKDPTHIFLSRIEAAEYLGCKEGTLAIWKCTKRYNLPYVKIGRNIRYRLSDLMEFVENNLKT